MARYFRTVFDADWSPAAWSPQKSIDYLKIARVIAVIGLLIVLITGGISAVMRRHFLNRRHAAGLVNALKTGITIKTDVSYEIFEEFSDFLAARTGHTSQRSMSLSPVTTASAQRSIIASSSDDNSIAPYPRFLLMYRDTAARVTPSLFAASLWLMPCLVTSRDTISALIGGRRFLTIRVAVHERAGVFGHTSAGWDSGVVTGLFWEMICRASRKLNFSMMRWRSLSFFRQSRHCLWRKPDFS